MEVDKLKHDTVERLRKVRKEQELTYGQILDMLEAKNYFLSEATLKRVFSENNDASSFKYRDTIAPLADVLLDLYNDNSGTDDVNALRSLIRDKNMIINILVAKNEELRSDFDKRVNHLKKQIDNLEEHLRFREKVVDQKDRELESKDELITRLLNKVIDI